MKLLPNDLNLQLERVRKAAIKSLEIYYSRDTDIREIKSVCLSLGPYRNLTTLSASIIALHPECQVLNHGGRRIFGDKRLNFLENPSDKVFDSFKKYAIYASQGGKRGQYGGSITLSHAFDSSVMKDLYSSRFSNEMLKSTIRCVFWKESLRTSNLIKINNIKLEEILEKHKELKFFMPVRNPIDCAISNVKSGHSKLFYEVNSPRDIQFILTAVLEEFRWFIELHKRYPDRLFYFYEHEFNREILSRLASFLDVSHDDRWFEDCMKVYKLKPSYQHNQKLLESYKEVVSSKFFDWPDIQYNLLKFIEP